MSQWQTLTSLQTQPLYLSLHNGSQETLEADDLISPELPPQSPVFDFDEFLNESSASKLSPSHQMSDPASATTQLAVQRDNGSLGPWPTWDPTTTVFHEEALNALQPSPSSFPHSASAINLSSSTMAPASSFTHYPSFSSQQSMSFKLQDAQVASPQSILSTVYEARAQFPPSQSAPYQPPSASFSDYELGITGSVIGMENNNDLFQLGKMDDQQIQLNYHEIGRLPYGDSGYAGAHQSMYAPQSIHQSASADGRASQRRVLVPRRDSSVPPYATDYRSPQSKAVFVASAPTPSILSDISSLSPGSPRSVQAVSVPGSSPSITSVSPRYITPTSPTAQFSASPAQFSASPHQFVGASPAAYVDASPITFVNQTAQYSTSARSDEPTFSSAPVSASGHKVFNPSKRRRPTTSDVEDDSDEKRNEDVPTKSELRPPKQAPSMWQIYFADWLQDHKTRHPHDKLNVAQAAKEAGQLYKTLDEGTIQDLKRRVQLEKDIRERRLNAWQRTLTPEDIKRENRFRAAQRKAGLSRRANIKDPNAPKKPLSAYFMFLARIRSDPALVYEVFGDETETTRQSVLAARRWREMSDEEKKPFLTQAEHDKIQYEALRKIYEEQAATASGSDSSRSANRKQMTGTGYIVPQQIHFSEDITAAIISARPSTSEPDDIRMVTYDPEATITARKSSNRSAPIPMFSSIGPIRRRVTRKASRTRHSLGDITTRSSSNTDDQRGGSDSGIESPESDDEWVPGKSI